jgi:hypothetical protein
MNPNTDTNYLTNSLVAAKQFAKQVVGKMQQGVERKPWGRYQSDYGATGTNLKTAVQNPSGTVAAAGLDVLTNATRRHVWNYTNMHRMMGDVGQYVGPRLGLESTLAGAAVAAAVPVALGTLSGQIGSPLQGFRPRGYRAVAPVSQEEDPTGKTTRSPVLEATMRYALGQKSALLPYQEFKKERPDVLPSTFVQYRRYERMKPEAGKSFRYDPESQSFAALGGVVRGTARGLNDPEIRLKGVPVTASAVIGTAAGLGAIKGLSKAMAPQPFKAEEGMSVKEAMKAMPPPSVGEKIGTSLGAYKDPALLAAGAVTAALVAHTTKKLFQKAAENRIKKENPIEYLKHKHGSLEEAKTALNQPEAQSWQQLSSYVK